MMFYGDFYFNILSSFSALPLLYLFPPIFVMGSHTWMVCTKWGKGKGSWSTGGKILSVNCINSVMGISQTILSKWKEGFCISSLEIVKFRGTAWTNRPLSLYCLRNSSESTSARFQKFSCRFVGRDFLICILQSATTAEVKYAEPALTLINIY